MNLSGLSQKPPPPSPSNQHKLFCITLLRELTGIPLFQSKRLIDDNPEALQNSREFMALVNSVKVYAQTQS